MSNSEPEKESKSTAKDVVLENPDSSKKESASSVATADDANITLSTEGIKDGERQIVVFKLGKEEFGVNINEVKEIIRMTDFTSIPNSAEYVRGVINLRGGIIPVIDLAKKLDISSLEENESNNNRIIVLEIGGNIIGLTVDQASEVLRINESSIKPAPKLVAKKIDSTLLEGVCVLGERLLILLDLEKVLSDKEISEVAAEAKE